MNITQDALEAHGRIRPMARHDVPVVSGMIMQLARHHGDEPQIDVSRLQADLFAPVPWLHGLVVERFGYVVGYALLTPLYRAQLSQRGLDLHHLFVLESSRGLGLGKRLVEAATAFARAEGCAFLAVGTHPDNRRAQDFYRTAGFEPRTVAGERFAMTL